VTFVEEPSVEELRALIRSTFAEEPQTLADLLDSVTQLVRRYVVLSQVQTTAVALWIAHTYALDAFDATGYLTITSPEKRSGKSRLLDLLALLVNKPWRVIDPTEAVVFRKVDDVVPTMLIDEADAVFGRKQERTEPLRAILNAGNQRDTIVSRCVPPSHAVTDFKVFCPKALAGIGRLPGTVSDRSIPIEMRRKTRAEECDRFRRREVEPVANGLRDRLSVWGAEAVEALTGALTRVEGLADDDAPLAALDDRAFEQAWEPLLAIADLAGSAWRARAIEAALVLSGEREPDEQSTGVRLLADIRSIFEEIGDDRTSSKHLATRLAEDADSPWADWYGKPITQNAIAKLLAPFGIHPRSVRLRDDTIPKGYLRGQFDDAWERYASPPSAEKRHTATTPVNGEEPAPQEPPQEPHVAGRKDEANPHDESDVADVADAPPSGWNPDEDELERLAELGHRYGLTDDG
jgi:hypothetical protein